jgi:hypothetical protein
VIRLTCSFQDPQDGRERLVDFDGNSKANATAKARHYFTGSRIAWHISTYKRIVENACTNRSEEQASTKLAY